MQIRQLIHDIENKRSQGQTYSSIAAGFGITKAMTWQIEHGYKPGKRVSAILQLDPDPDLLYTRTRREHLDAIAQRWGYVSWCAYETAVIHADATKGQ